MLATSAIRFAIQPELEDEFRDVDLGEYVQVQHDDNLQGAPQAAPQWATFTVLCSAAGLFVSAVLLLAQYAAPKGL
jgi:hypothetical protein